MPRGGKRPGSGRKSNAEKFEKQIDTVETKLAGKLSKMADNVIALANGGIPTVQEVFEAAGTVMVDDVEVTETDKGPRSVRIKRKAFPDKKDDELVLVKRTVTIQGPNLAANVYALDRIMGKPTERQEITGQDGGAIEVNLDATIERVYGEPEEAPAAVE